MKKETRHILRAKTTLFLVMFSPVLLLLTMGFAFTVEVKNTPVAIMDRDRTALTRSYINKLAATNDLDVCCKAESYAEIESWLERGRIKAAVVLPNNFTADIERGEGSDLQVIIDGTDPTTAEHAVSHITMRALAFAEELMLTQLQRRGVYVGQVNTSGAVMMPIDLRLRTWYNPAMKTGVGVIPALVAVVLTMPAVSASLAITREKEHGTMEGLIATPISRAELLIGKLVPYVISGLFSAVLCALTAIWVFEVPFRGSWLLYMLLTVDFLWATLALSMVISMLVSTQNAAMIITMLVFMFPGLFLSGIFFPLIAMPPEAALEAHMVPTTHYVFILRGIFLKGQSLGMLWQYAVALLVMGILASVLAVMLFKKRLT